MWTDFELTCVGPRELDLTCNDTSARPWPDPEDEEFLAGTASTTAGCDCGWRVSNWRC